MTLPAPDDGQSISLDEVQEVLSSHSDGVDAVHAVGNYLMSGGDSVALTRTPSCNMP